MRGLPTGVWPAPRYQDDLGSLTPAGGPLDRAPVQLLCGNCKGFCDINSRTSQSPHCYIGGVILAEDANKSTISLKSPAERERID